MANHYCELLDGRCGKLATATVKGVRVCAEHAEQLRPIARRRLCPGCNRNIARKGGTCSTCARARRRQAA